MIAIIVIVLLAVSQFSANIYTPSMPSMEHLLHTTTSDIQFSLSIYYLAFGASQFVYGPLSDSYGRRRVILAGLWIYLIGTLLIILEPSSKTLLVGRFIQGLGIGSGMVVGRSVLCDVYRGEALRKISNLLSIIVVLVPIISPLCGAFFERYYSWVTTFEFLFFICLMSLIFTFVTLPETNQHPSGRIQPLRVMRSFWQALRQVEFTRYSLSGGIIFSIVAVMYVSLPFLLVHLLKLSPFALSVVLIIGIFFCIGGSVISSILIRFMRVEQLYRLGFLCLFTGLFVGTFFYTAGYGPTLFRLLGPIFIMLVGTGIIFPNAMADALAAPGIDTGIASAIFSGFQMLSAGIASGVMSSFNTGSALPLIIVSAGILIMTLLSYYLPTILKVTD
jgi:DHA1 family 2-module integral membrane pump EmrD-like MFS transporter